MIIDATRLTRRALNGERPSGIDRVSLEYVRHYGSQAQAYITWRGRSFILSPRRSRRLWDLLLQPTAPARGELTRHVAAGAASGLLRRYDVGGRVFLNTAHSGLEDPSYGPKLRALGVKPVFFIHDLIPLTHPEYAGAAGFERHTQRLRTTLEHAAGVITNSQATSDDLAAHARRLEMDMPPTVAALLASGVRHNTVAGAPPLAEPYFVILGTIEPRKNHWLILQLWRQLSERHGRATPKLLIVGQRGWESENVLRLLDRCEALRDCVIERPDCGDDELAHTLQHARALLFPSFAEGYGMPLIEALALGAPAIVSDLPVFREVAGDIPEYIDPLDGRRWAEVVMDYASQAGRLRPLQKERMAGFKEPTWSQHFTLVDGLLGRLNAGK